MAETQRPLDERVASVEAQVSSLARSIESLGKTVESGFADSRRERADLNADSQRALRSLESRLSDTQRTPWGALASWAAVVLAIGALVATSMQRSSDSQAQRIADLEGSRLESTYQRGKLDGRLDGMERTVVALDSKIQAELDAHVKRLDDKLQIEMKGQNDLVSRDVSWIKDRLDKLVAVYQGLDGAVRDSTSRGERLDEKSRWLEDGFRALDDRGRAVGSTLEAAVAKQGERAAVFEDLKRRVLALEERSEKAQLPRAPENP